MLGGPATEKSLQPRKVIVMYRILMSMFMFLVIFSAPLYAEVKGEFVNYTDGKTQLIGYIAWDDAIKGKRPGIIVVPDWWGHGMFVRVRADELAQSGYTAIVMDMYGNGKYVESPEDAKQLMDEFTADPNAMEARFDATLKTIRKHPTVNPKKVAAIGYSLGGKVVLEMARQGKDLAGVASIWGVVDTPVKPAAKGAVKARVLVQAPEKDDWAPKDKVKALEKEMKNAGAKIKVIVYKGTVHGWSRPDATMRAKKYKLGIRFDANAMLKSQKDLNKFLKTSFK
jgi:dienelactone hydrolase